MPCTRTHACMQPSKRILLLLHLLLLLLYIVCPKCPSPAVLLVRDLAGASRRGVGDGDCTPARSGTVRVRVSLSPSLCLPGARHLWVASAGRRPRLLPSKVPVHPRLWSARRTSKGGGAVIDPLHMVWHPSLHSAWAGKEITQTTDMRALGCAAHTYIHSLQRPGGWKVTLTERQVRQVSRARKDKLGEQDGGRGVCTASRIAGRRSVVNRIAAASAAAATLIVASSSV